MECNMGYHSMINFYKMLKLIGCAEKNVKMQRKIGQFALYTCSGALTTAVTHVDD